MSKAQGHGAYLPSSYRAEHDSSNALCDSVGLIISFLKFEEFKNYKIFIDFYTQHHH